MVNKNKQIITKNGLRELNDELERRMTIDREKIADLIKIAREQGDLSENSAYKSAMEDKEFNENRIEELKKMIANSEVGKKDPTNKAIEIGEEFILVNMENKREFCYMLVGSSEADPSKSKISIDSPIGNAVKGKKYGDRVQILLPTGEAEFTIKKK